MTTYVLLGDSAAIKGFVLEEDQLLEWCNREPRKFRYNKSERQWYMRYNTGPDVKVFTFRAKTKDWQYGV